MKLIYPASFPCRSDKKQFDTRFGLANMGVARTLLPTEKREIRETGFDWLGKEIHREYFLVNQRE